MKTYSIRPATPEDCPAIAVVQVDSYRAAYAGLFPQAYLDQFSYEDQARDWLTWMQKKPDDILLVAVTPENEVRGYMLARYQPEIYPGYDGELIALHVRPPLKGEGVGRALLRSAVEALVAKGSTKVMLWTLRGNPIRSWYERLGGTLLAEKRDWWDDWEMVEVAYGWEDVPALLQRL
jgi:ribosomal protein S18 acetylase RimI-like enzyme